MSVRARITLWSVAVLLTIVGVFAVGVYAFVRARLVDQSEAQVDVAYRSLEKVVEDDPREAYEVESHGGVSMYEVRDGDAIVHRTPAWERAGLDVRTLRDGVSTLSSADGRSFLVRTGMAGRYRIAAAAEDTAAREATHTLASILLLGIPCAGLLALGGGWFLAGRALTPVSRMAKTATRITAARLSERLPVENPRDELGRLATAFNETLTRLEASFTQLRRFTSDASHELRTPLTAMRSVGEVALQTPHDAAFYRDVIGSMLEETDRLSRLVESLLTLTRADEGVVALTRESVDVCALVRSSIDLLRVLADEKALAVTLDAEGSVIALADPSILGQAIVNVLDNAIKYTPEGGSIHVAVRDDKGRAFIEVRDTGPGIAAGEREHVFERFYRVDAARSRQGGVGLGLAIARWAVEVNGGRITLESPEGRGCIFRIALSARS